MSPKKTEGPVVLDIGKEIEALDGKARRSESKEAYLQVASGPDHRIGVTATVLPDGPVIYSIEFLKCVLGPSCVIDVPLLEEAIWISKELKRRGYEPFHQDDGWICCEKALAREDIPGECEILANIAKGRPRPGGKKG